MTDLIICDGAIMNEILRITADGKLVSNNEALKPVIDYIEELERERDDALIKQAAWHLEAEMMAANFAKAVEALNKISCNANIKIARFARDTLNELEWEG
jgi:hypothetical protein